jgi:hypothetical protein
MDHEDTNHIEQLYNTLDIPINTKNFNYTGLEYLNEDLSSLVSKLNENNKIHICAYNINTISKYPFLQYFLYKPYSNDNINNFSFPYFYYKDGIDLISKSMSIIHVLCSTFYKDTIFNFKGFLIENNDVYLFFDCSHMIIDTLHLTINNDLWLVIIDEIINHKNVYGFNIENNVSDLFIKYNKLSYLIDDENEHYPLPIIGYANCLYNQIDFVSTFGIYLNNGLFGNYYYFTDFINAQKHNNDKYGLVRCILFTDHLYIIYNNDDYIKEDIIKNWHLLFDTLYIGNIELDDASFTEGPIWIIKNYDQYHVISCHIVKN